MPEEKRLTRDEVHAEYKRHHAMRREQEAEYSRQELAISRSRVAVFCVGLLVVALAVWSQALSLWWSVLPLLVFLALVHRHDRIIQQHQRAKRAAAFYESGLGRLEDRWMGRGNAGSGFLDPAHPCAVDLDLFGVGSLFELLCAARTRSGEVCLAGWLLNPAVPEVIRARQEAVRELRDRLELREEMSLLGDEVRPVARPGEFAVWGQSPAAPFPAFLRPMAVMLALSTLTALIAGMSGYGWLAATGLFVLEQIAVFPWQRRATQIARSIEKPARELALLSELLLRLEQESFSSPALRELQGALAAEGSPPSIRIARLQTILDWLDAQRNQLFAPIAMVLLWNIQFSYALEGWRLENGPYLEKWLHVVGEFEALSSLAGYAFENPDDPFPKIVEEEVCFEAVGLTHPLLPQERAVRNDISLTAEARLYIVSGSNMSGKSTFLRAIGVNAVLALAGAPVRARSLRLSPVCIGASLRTQDSLQAGISRFYAEIQRLRQIVDLAEGTLPLLFLLDEILHGTNSHDRQQGAEAIVRSLLARKTLGLLTTHDLALASIAARSDYPARNVHFEDQITEGRMEFDYQLRPGVVEKSNAIALMRAVGLDV